MSATHQTRAVLARCGGGNPPTSASPPPPLSDPDAGRDYLPAAFLPTGTTPGLSRGSPGGSSRWSDAEKDRLVALRKAGTPLADCAAALGRTIAAVKLQINRSRLGQQTNKPWTAAEVLTLIRMKREGRHSRDIATAVGHSVTSCAEKWTACRIRLRAAGRLP